jgi:hypothetical protein
MAQHLDLDPQPAALPLEIPTLPDKVNEQAQLSILLHLCLKESRAI